MKKVSITALALLLAGPSLAGWNQLQWGADYSVNPHLIGINLSGTWHTFATISPTGEIQQNVSSIALSLANPYDQAVISVTGAQSGAKASDQGVIKASFADTVAVVGGGTYYGLAVVDTISGTQATGARVGVEGQVVLASQTGQSNPNRNYFGVEGQCQSTANDTGTGVVAAGSCGGTKGVAWLKSGATFYSTVAALQGDARIDAGGSASFRFGALLRSLGDSAAGTVDAGLALRRSSTSPGFTDGILLDDSTGYFPVAVGGTILKSGTGGASPVSLANGIDLSRTAFSGCAFKSSNFCLKDTAGSTADQFTLDGSGSVGGANLRLIGNGATTPVKTMRVRAGSLEVVNNAGTAVIFSLTDAGTGVFAGNLQADNIGSFGYSSAVTYLSAGTYVTAPVHYSTSAAPVVSSCGTNPVVGAGSSNHGGYIQTGTGSPTTCGISFAQPFPNYAFCTVSPYGWDPFSNRIWIAAINKAYFTVQFAAAATSYPFTYNCQGN